MIAAQHIHPMIVHFPIVSVFFLAFFDLVATMRRVSITTRTPSGNVSTGLAVIAGLSAIAAYGFGDLALGVAEARGFSSEVAEIHEGLGTTFAIAIAIWAMIRAVLWWRNRPVTGPTAFIFPAVAVAGALLVTATGYYGGQLVFDLGVNVSKALSGG